MNHRHLLPNEIDLLLDEEVGFGVAPLRAHLRDCAECRARVDEARTVFDALEELPHLAPAFDFADRVMTQVPVFVPWHVAARDALARLTPRSRPARVAALAIGTSVATFLTVAILWIATRPDLLVFASGVIGERVPALVGSGARDLVVALFGDEVFTAIERTGIVGLALGLVGFLVVAASALAGLRAIATASHRRRV